VQETARGADLQLQHRAPDTLPSIPQRALLSSASLFGAYKVLLGRRPSCKQKRPRGAAINFFFCCRTGDGIRTHDPNLGNVLLTFSPLFLFARKNTLIPYSERVFLGFRTAGPILDLPGDLLPRASPVLPRPPPPGPGKQNQNTMRTRTGSHHGKNYEEGRRRA